MPRGGILEQTRECTLLVVETSVASKASHDPSDESPGFGLSNTFYEAARRGAARAVALSTIVQNCFDKRINEQTNSQTVITARSKQHACVPLQPARLSDTAAREGESGAPARASSAPTVAKGGRHAPAASTRAQTPDLCTSYAPHPLRNRDEGQRACPPTSPATARRPPAHRGEHR